MRPATTLAVILLAGLGHLPGALAAEPRRSSVTVDYLYEACSAAGQTARGMIPYFDCRSYVYGVLDSHLAVRRYLPSDHGACFPASISPEEVLKIGQDALLQDHGSEEAGPALIEMLRKKYPCKK